jgi:peptidase E
MAGHVVAVGGGAAWQDPRFAELVLSLARGPRPRVCYVGTAGGDPPAYIAAFYRRFAALDCRPADLTFFERSIDDLTGFVAEQDVFLVGGGSTANLLAVWRVHGLDRLLTDAHAGGAVLAGVSAGMNCWFQSSTTDSFGPELAPLHDGLGLLEGSACPHYDGEPQRRPLYRRLVADGTLPPGYAADDGAALHFHDGDVRALSFAEGALAYRVTPEGETPLEA